MKIMLRGGTDSPITRRKVFITLRLVAVGSQIAPFMSKGLHRHVTTRP